MSFRNRSGRFDDNNSGQKRRSRFDDNGHGNGPFPNRQRGFDDHNSAQNSSGGGSRWDNNQYDSYGGNGYGPPNRGGYNSTPSGGNYNTGQGADSAYNSGGYGSYGSQTSSGGYYSNQQAGGGYPNQQPANNYPNQQPANNYPNQQPANNYPGHYGSYGGQAGGYSSTGYSGASGYASGPPPPPPPSSDGGSQITAPAALPPAPPVWDPAYLDWYRKYQQQQQGGYVAQSNASDSSGPSPAKQPCLDVAPPLPPSSSDQSQKPEWQAVKKGAVIYETPRAPTPEPPKRPSPPLPPIPEPQKSEILSDIDGWKMEDEAAAPVSKQKMQWWYDGESWIYAAEKPPVKEKAHNPEFNYTYASGDNPVDRAVLANIRGTYTDGDPRPGAGNPRPGNRPFFKKEKPDKPKPVPVYCETCSLTVPCQVTYQSHINGKNHKKRLVQLEKAEKVKEKKTALTIAKIEAAKAKVEAQLEGKPVPNIDVEQKEKELNMEDPVEVQPNGDYKCVICNVFMNSKECASTHLAGKNHKKAVERMKKNPQFRQKPKAAAAAPNSPGSFIGPTKPAAAATAAEATNVSKKPTSGASSSAAAAKLGATHFGEGSAIQDIMKDINTPVINDRELDKCATDEYNKVFEESKSAGMDELTCKRLAMAAKDTVRTKGQRLNTMWHEMWPPEGVVIVFSPVQGFRCMYCKENLSTKISLLTHIESDEHKEASLKSDSTANLISNEEATSNVKTVVLPGGSSSSQKVYRGNATRQSVVMAQRGRSGLISQGEYVPNKLSKSEKKAGKDIASMVKQTTQTNTGKVVPILMNFVKGGTIQSNEPCILPPKNP